MTQINANDDGHGPSQFSAYDAHGKAALLLVEALIHGLIERSLITLGDALDIVDTARDIAAESLLPQGAMLPRVRTSADIIDEIHGSLASNINTDQ